MTATHLRSVEPEIVHEWMAAGDAVLIDIREPDEHARANIRGARLMPLSAFNPFDLADLHDKKVIFHCQTGTRTAQGEDQLLSAQIDGAYQLKGGLTAWTRAGLPIDFNIKAPISIMRQVQITAGSMIVLGIVLAHVVNPWFLALSAFVGAGLVFAGVTGTCALATILGAMPWNRRPKAESALPAAPA